MQKNNAILLNNCGIFYNQRTKMYTLFNVVKHNTDIKGYWKDSDKVFIDNIVLVPCKNKDILKDRINELFRSEELAVFYCDGEKGYIQDNKGKITILNKREIFKFKKGYSNIQDIKDIINKYGGCTVHSKKGYILIEVYTN